MAKRVYLETLTPAIRAAAQMRHRDFQRECIVRGLSFEFVLTMDHTQLVEWFVTNYDNGQDLTRLSQFDAFVDAELIKRGYKKGDALLHPSLKFGYIPTSSINSPSSPTLSPRNSTPKTTKVTSSPKREKDSHGLVSGTKKSYTYELAEQGLPLPEIISQVKERFPEAQESSIKIWVGRVKKGKHV